MRPPSAHALRLAALARLVLRQQRHEEEGALSRQSRLVCCATPTVVGGVLFERARRVRPEQAVVLAQDDLGHHPIIDRDPRDLAPDGIGPPPRRLPAPITH